MGKLDELFFRWEKKGLSFVPDGFLGEENDVEILYVCRESHIGNDNHEIDKTKRNEFWMKKQVSAWCEGGETIFNFKNNTVSFTGRSKSIGSKKSKQAATRFVKCMMKCYYEALEKKDNEINVKVLANCAYMNLNKRGGGARISAEFKEYVKEDVTEIKEEIRLINPKKIIILGEIDDEIKEIIFCNFKNIDIKQYTYHPSDRAKIYSGELLEYN